MRFNLAGLVVPETWDSLDNFIHWYRVNGYPFRIPLRHKTFVTDHSYSMIVFEQDVYSVELYIGAANLDSPKHKHPFESKVLFCGGSIKARRGRDFNEEPPFVELGPRSAGSVGPPVREGEWHQLTTETGFMIMTFSKWPSKDHLTSAVVAYEGETMGPIHQALIENNRH